MRARIDRCGVNRDSLTELCIALQHDNSSVEINLRRVPLRLTLLNGDACLVSCNYLEELLGGFLQLLVLEQFGGGR
jgi:hypothetical protein